MTPPVAAHYTRFHRPRLLLIWLLLASVGVAHATVRYYVSPSGKDTWTGEIAASKMHLWGGRDGPFRTLDRALAAVAHLRTEATFTGEAVILLRAGTYTMPAPLTLTATDAALSSGQLTLRAYPDETVVLQGCTQETAWIDCHNGLFRTPLPTEPAEQSRQVFWNGMVQPRARHPNRDSSHPYSGGFLYAAEPATGTSRQTLTVRPGDIPPEFWPDLESAALWVWPAAGGLPLRSRITGADQQSRMLTLENAAETPLTKGSRYVLERSFDFLDAPGEWYHDQARQMLYFRPPDGRPPKRATTVVTTPWILALQGTPEKPIRNVALEGLEFRGASAALLLLQYAEDCRITACRFRMAGANGILLQGEGRGCRIAGCDMEGIPGIAVDVAPGYSETVVVNTWIRDCGDSGMPAIRFAGSGVVSGNLLHDLGAAALRITGRKVTCESNLIHHTFTRSSGGAALEVMCSDPLGEPPVIRQNWIRHTGGYQATSQGRWQYPVGVAGLLLDCDGRVEVRGNRIEQASGYGVLLRRGQLALNNNLFLYNAKAQIAVEPTGADAPTLQLTNCVFAYNGADAFWLTAPQPLQSVVSESRGNLIWPHAGTVRMLPSLSSGADHWGAWQDAGFDLRSVVADPCFVAPADGNFRLRPDSFALKLGFEPLLTEVAGLTVTNERSTLPAIMKPWREAYLPGPWGQPRPGETDSATTPVADATLDVPYRRLPPVLDGLCGEDEWPDGAYAGKLIQHPDGDPDRHTVFPAALRLAHDGGNLYVTVTIPVTTLQSGMRWGQDDGVELRIGTPGANETLVARGFPNGYTETEIKSASGDSRKPAGADPGTVPYAACILPGAWSCEWAIPIARQGDGSSSADEVEIRIAVQRSGDAEHLVWPATTTAPGSDLPGARLRLHANAAP